MSEEDTAACLCKLVRAGRLESLELYLQSGADPNATDYDGRTALLLAALQGRLEMVELLVARGARVVGIEALGETPQQAAERNGYSKVAEFLATVSAASAAGLTA